MGMSVEWVAQTDWMVCSACGKRIGEGKTVVGDFDKFFHKNHEDCESEEYESVVYESK